MSNTMHSNCCGAPVIPDDIEMSVCPECGNWCWLLEEEDTNPVIDQIIEDKLWP